MTTVETALSLATLVTVAAAIIAGIAAMSAYIAAVDIAGAAARAYSLGVDYEAPRGAVTVSQSGGLASAVATVPAPVGAMTYTAIFPVEFK